MEPAKEQEPSSLIRPTGNEDFDALEEQLNAVIGNLQEKVPVVEVHPVAPPFTLGATPEYVAPEYTSPVSTEPSENQSALVDRTPTSSGEGFHTISGGQETLKELNEKAAPAIHRMNAEAVAATSVHAKVQAPAHFVEEKIFLSSSLFFWFSAVTFIFIMLGAGLPFIAELLVEHGYLVLDSALYRDGALSFPVGLVDNMLLLTFQLTAASIFVLIVTGTIDYGIKKDLGETARTVIHWVILILFIAIIFFFCKDQGVTSDQIKQLFAVLKESLGRILQSLEGNRSDI
jgi:hypothetical protein